MNSVIIVAAGRGSRMQSSVNKQYIRLLGKCILLRTMEKFLAMDEIHEIVVVIAKADREIFKEMMEEELHKNPRLIGNKRVAVAYGGKERADSVANGLSKVHPQASMILIHDGVRPFVTPKEILSVIEKARQCGGAVLGVKPKDTLKTINNGFVIETIPRENVVHIQTPQCFGAKKIRDAYHRLEELTQGSEATDDASLLERAGLPVGIVEGSYENIKITTPIDIMLGEEILRVCKER